MPRAAYSRVLGLIRSKPRLLSGQFSSAHRLGRSVRLACPLLRRRVESGLGKVGKVHDAVDCKCANSGSAPQPVVLTKAPKSASRAGPETLGAWRPNSCPMGVAVDLHWQNAGCLISQAYFAMLNVDPGNSVGPGAAPDSCLPTRNRAEASIKD